MTLRSLAGTCLLWLLAALPFGLFLALSGNLPVSAGSALALVGLFTMISNAKRAMLGEALVFSDLALLGAVFRHPQFYFSALTRVQKTLLALAAPVVPLLLLAVFVPELTPHLAGLAVIGASAIMLRAAVRARPWSDLARQPDSEADVQRHGLIPTVFLHWLRWRETGDPHPAPPVEAAVQNDELVILIQCESFADPADLFGEAAPSLPALDGARALAWSYGKLAVHGFGAYTMRTEYGVLFGRSEAELGFRRFDPFLTATGEASYALPARLNGAGWRSIFVHPHDMRFYNRAEIMAAGGFSELVGEERFAQPAADEGRYVTDAAMADEILRLAADAACPTLIYAVTIENHGPWNAAAGDDPRSVYLRLLGKGDAMLAKLSDGLRALKRPATLVFFGDHRPSIPGLCDPGNERHTPFVVLRFDACGKPVKGNGSVQTFTPAQLHHHVLDLLKGEC
ncbi:LTA synthase family protein [Novosphingobium sp. ERN07]|uniref:LTA synthase family protein n=1 Tax=Novosphingobium sp. ERN07 TaxID=2726187 RepID=UPI0014575A03|nr:LTA synthase family protein [Novosphingobium sp. ERN07]NLR72472.1 LTA synthase family protein [Novosphingobium sp. ERN07]